MAITYHNTLTLTHLSGDCRDSGSAMAVSIQNHSSVTPLSGELCNFPVYAT